ncbi:MAG: 4-hydroxythreonine-4-phosphate dehydrogenase PdxA [Pseudomonadales bacterium]|nr:4-hydroxythreonine-4-phosphate dehydrogenase PdxA [Pseudomonadales bacterium]
MALTPGEPSGIGPDLAVQVAQVQQNYPLVVIADPDLLISRAKRLNFPLKLKEYPAQDQSLITEAQTLYVSPVKMPAPSEAGTLNPDNSQYVLDTLTLACQGCQSGLFDAMVTGPVNKSAINAAGVDFTGHTEFLQELTNTEQVVMMLACDGLRVALVTTHLPLSQVAESITEKKLTQIIRITDNALQTQFGIEHPRLTICGLNPHAGESGYLGREEIDIIEPCLAQLREQGHLLKGPLPADTLFTPPILESTDAVIAMYHDQGLPVLKYKGFGNAINITLGLPIIRTSVDHGTALELAGTGKAKTGSLLAALNQAVIMATESLTTTLTTNSTTTLTALNS